MLQLEKWLEEPEHRFEFKQARSGFSYDELKEYAVGIANVGGGKLIFGVTDEKPRRVVGSNAFLSPEKTEGNLCRDLQHLFHFQEIYHRDGRVLVLHIPHYPVGRPLSIRGRFLRRAGESLVPMEAAEVARLTRGDFDYSSSICEEARLSDLDENAISNFRVLLESRSPNLLRQNLSDEQLLADYDLIRNGKVTIAALLLLGRSSSLTVHLKQAEFIFEYRSDETQIRHDQRVTFRSGFLLWQQELWELIDRRNSIQFVQDGFVNRSIRTFTERVTREAVLNAVSHRDYQVPGSVFVRQGPRSLEVVSPGGFPAGITPETALRRQFPRNRSLAEALERSGLVERSGQGVDLMFDMSLREGKRPPDYNGSSEHEVRLLLRGDIQNPEFVRFLEKVGSESGFRFGTEDLIVLDHISWSGTVPVEYRGRLNRLLDAGIIERIGRGKGARLLLSRRFYTYLGQPGLYTAKIGLTRQANKMLLLEHIERTGSEGASFSELQYVLPAASRAMIKIFLDQLRSEGRIMLRGANRGAKWLSIPVEKMSKLAQ